MAATTQTAHITISINDIEVQVPKGELIVESVKRLGLEIPIFCYHSRMKPVGMCRMCLVEVGFKQPDGSVRKMPKPQAGCTLPASEGMAIYTDTAMVQKDRKGVLEFLLANHPLDCPICDRGGECPLQNNTLYYGPSTSRFLEQKRHLPKAFPLSKYVTLDLERCIQCGRCVRFTEEISGDSQLAFRFRGGQMQPSTFELSDFTSRFSGNVIEICPVGALTSTEYRFRARPWDLESKPGICTRCSNGCNIWVDYRAGQLVRVNGRANEAINEEWTCDKGKFGHGFYNSDKRVKTPLVRNGDRLEPCSWAQAYAAILAAFTNGGKKVATLAGRDLSNEDLFLLQSLFRGTFGSQNIDYRFWSQLPKDMGALMDVATIESFETAPTIVIFESALEDELPIVYLRIRKAATRCGVKVVVASSRPNEAEEFATSVLRFRPGSGPALCKALSGDLDLAKAEIETGISAALLRSTVAEMNGASIVCSESLWSQDGAQENFDSITLLAKALGGTLSVFQTGANSVGCQRLGVTPSNGGLDTHGIIQGCKGGTIEALWLAGVDPFEHDSSDSMREALENVSFLVHQTSVQTEVTNYASVVLPMAAPAEREGTYTNCEGRVQRMNSILAAPGESRPAWRTFSECIFRVSQKGLYFNAGEVMEAIGKAVPSYKVADYSILSEGGSLLV